MTTQNTHQEQYDVDANVVEYSSTPEPTNAPEASDANLSAEAEAQASENPIEPETLENAEKPEEQVPSPEAESANSDQVDKVEAESKDTAAAVAVQKEEEEQKETAGSEQQETQNIEESERVVSVDQPAPVASEQETVEETPTYTYTTDIPLTEVEAEIRPFTDFIEEFRQAEARLQASVQESETEVFHATAPADVTAAEQQTLPEVNLLEEVSVPEALLKSIDDARIETAITFPQESPALAIPATDVESDMSKEKESTLVAEAVNLSDPGENSGISEVPTAQEEQTAKAAQEETTASSKPAERAVSPLLRPPTARLRIPRHGTARHPQREALAEVQPEAEQLLVNKVEEPVTLSAPAAVEIPSIQAEGAAVAEEKPAEVEKPRPARRYRIDRPA